MNLHKNSVRYYYNITSRCKYDKYHVYVKNKYFWVDGKGIFIYSRIRDNTFKTLQFWVGPIILCDCGYFYAHDNHIKTLTIKFVAPYGARIKYHNICDMNICDKQIEIVVIPS